MPDKRPNIVYILADDMGYGDMVCNNPGSKIPTPNLDRLAAQGMRFTDAHAASSVCTPSRYSLCPSHCPPHRRQDRGRPGDREPEDSSASQVRETWTMF